MPTLILLRHGESEWNLSGLFTGWVDVDLSERGEREAARAGRLIHDEGIAPDILHTSLQKRAIRTADIALRELDRLWIPVRRSWRLNERHYGALQGLDKKKTAAQYGLDQVKVWRRSYNVRPPDLDDERWAEQRTDARYAELPDDALPRAECLEDVVERMIPYWLDDIVPELHDGKTVLVVAHGNSLRALVKHLDGIPDAAIVDLDIPTGNPILYTLDEQMHATGWRYLDAEGAKAAAEAVARQAG
jgi:2,3-bisphosphoglycerate-dependent phosphoglycerate mutase